MPRPTQDAQALIQTIQKALARFEKASGHHQRDESFVAVDDLRYSLVVKVRSPFGDGVTEEKVESTNELQQRVNSWLSIQRELGTLAAVRLTITPALEDQQRTDR